MKLERIRGVTAASSVAVLLALAGCGDRADTTTSQPADPGAQPSASATASAEARPEAAATQENAAAEERREQVAALPPQQDRDTAATAEANRTGATATTGAAGTPDSQRQASGSADATITTKVNTGLSVDRDLSALRIDVDTRDGVVTLTGKAPSEDAKRRAERIATHVADVRSVRNELVVEGQAGSGPGSSSSAQASSSGTSAMGAAGSSPPPASSSGVASDPQISARVNEGLAADQGLSIVHIDVETRNREVTLKGKVPTAEAKERAERIARAVPEVRGVTNQLEVDAGATAATGVRTGTGTSTTSMGASSDRDRSLGTVLDDTGITAKVNTGLAVDKELSAMGINVETREGVVTLKGRAPTQAAKQRAEEIARHVQDVRSVRNELTVGG